MCTKIDIEKELHLITEALAHFINGASLQDVKNASGLNIETRSLQRCLEKLKDLGLITITGNTRATVYRLVNDGAEQAKVTTTSTIKLGADIVLSKEAVEIKHLIERALSKRIPVGYQQDFLLSYRLNIDSYLSDVEKVKLAEIGKTNTADQPAGTYAKSVLERLLIDLSWNSGRLEGNTYSFLDTQHILSQGKQTACCFSYAVTIVRPLFFNY